MTTGKFKYIDPASFGAAKSKPWSKVDDGGRSFDEVTVSRPVNNARGHESEFSVDRSGFQFLKAPAKETRFTNDEAVRSGYYSEVEELLKKTIPGIKKVVIFDHTIRRHETTSARQPVNQVHVDQTPKAAEARVYRHLAKSEADKLVKGRYQIINVWRPIANSASDYPLAVVDWRSTSPADLVPVDLLYPKRDSNDDDDRGKEVLPKEKSKTSTEGYEPKGETFAVAPSENHKFYYMKDMTPDEALFIKCFDSFGQGFPLGKDGVANYTPHTAFIDPQTPADAPGRQSIEVRCLVFYD